MLPGLHARRPKARAAHADERVHTGTGAGPSPRNRRLYIRTLGSLPIQSPSPWGPRSHLQGLGSGTPRPPVYPGPWRGRRFQEGGPFAAATEHKKPRLCGAGESAPARDPAWSSARALGGAPRSKSAIPPPEASRERWEASASRRDGGQRRPGQALASHADPRPARTTCCVTLDGIKTSEPYLSVSL